MEHTVRYKGTERLILDGEPLRYSMLDFWCMNYSTILLNMTRGIFAEFLVRCAMAENGMDTLSSSETGIDPYDIDGPEILTMHGIRSSRIEVKSAASIQIDTPDEKEPLSLSPSQLIFSIRKAIDWQSTSQEPRRNNDLYVFAHYKATRKSDNILDLKFWDFYVYPTYKIDENTDTGLSEQKTISIRRLQMIGLQPVSFRDLYQEILKVTSDISNHYSQLVNHGGMYDQTNN